MRVLILAIDALDRELLDVFAADLPNFARLRASGRLLPVRSTFPPDSDTAWATVVTGIGPAHHGIVRFVDPLRKSFEILNIGIPNEALRGRTFWDAAGEAGLKSVIVFPHLGFPLWDGPPNTQIIARSSTRPAVAARPASLVDGYPDPTILEGIRGFPGRGRLHVHRDRLHALATADARFGLDLLQGQPWDLFFMYWSTIDAVGHFFWSTFDREDPAYVPNNALQDVIPETYRMFDRFLGSFLANVGSDTTVIVMSDHGHAGRPYRLVNINEILRRAGFLRARDHRRHPHVRLIERTKRTAVRTVSRYGLGRLAGQVIRQVPGALESFTRPALIDWDKTLAYASDMSGIKAYSYGGITINRDALRSQSTYEAVRSEVIDAVRAASVTDDGRSILSFAMAREEVYSGPKLGNYPDILLEFVAGYGLGWAVETDVFTTAASHNLVPGSHRADTATFIVRSGRDVSASMVDLLDVAPTILDLLDLQPSEGHQGRTLFAPPQ